MANWLGKIKEFLSNEETVSQSMMKLTVKQRKENTVKENMEGVFFNEEPRGDTIGTSPFDHYRN